MKKKRISYFFILLLAVSLFSFSASAWWWSCNEVGDTCCDENPPCRRANLECSPTNRCRLRVTGGGGGGGSTTCATQTLGCYNAQNTKVDPGILKPNEFGQNEEGTARGYYLPSNKCLTTASNSSGGAGGGGSGGGGGGREENPEMQAFVISEITGNQISSSCGDRVCAGGNECTACPDDCRDMPACNTNACDSQTQPSPDWGTKQGICLRSCGSLAGADAIASNVPCSSRSLTDAGPAYDVNYCCTDSSVNRTSGGGSNSSGGSSGCTCPSGSSRDVVEVRNADASQESCGCVKGTSYDSSVSEANRCCGDDAQDCGRVEGGKICSMPLRLEGTAVSTWNDATSKRGDAIKVPCNGALYISDGARWIKCDGTFEGNQRKVRIGSHEYLCIGFGANSIVECCGSGACTSRDSNVQRITTGQYRNPRQFTSETPPSFSISAMAVGITGLVTGEENEERCGAGVGASCDAPPGPQLYKSAVESAISSFLSANPEVADAPNDDDAAVSAFLTGVAEVLKSQGYVAGRAINCNGNDGSDSVMVGRPSDTFLQYYDIIVGSGSGERLGSSAGIGYWERASRARLVPSTFTGFGNNTNYYCRADGTFTTRLDSGGGGSSFVNPDTNREACLQAGYRWTGSKCCGEPGNCEYYNDPGGNGGCFRSAYVPSISIVNNTQNSTINYQGVFYGCKIAARNYNTQNDALLYLLDKGTARGLITDLDYCTNDPNRNFFCSFREQWLPTLGRNRTRLSYSPNESSSQLAECCGQNECWDGNTCAANQRNNPTARPISGKRCIDGEWRPAFLRFTPDDSGSGYCAEETQCLLNPLAQNQQQCVNSGSYNNDDYCENGIWSTRTKLLATKLLVMKSGNYAVSCDSSNNALNNLQYTESGLNPSSVLQAFGANNFCVLKDSSKVVAGFSINTGLENTSQELLNILRISSCSGGLADDGQYHSCDSSNRVWYNRRLRSIIFSSSAITVPVEQSQSGAFHNFILNPIQAIVARIRALINPTPNPDTYFVDRLRKFDRLYLQEQDGKIIRGVLEGHSNKNLVLGYSGFNSDICTYVSQFNNARLDSASGIACRRENNNFYVLAQGSRTTNINPELLWQDLTSKMRIS